jgi:hypothetical protein
MIHMSENVELEQLLRDVREVRRAVDRADGATRSPGYGSLGAHKMIHVLCIILSAALLILDTAVSPSLTTLLYATASNTDFFTLLRYVSVLMILALLVCLCGVVYLLVWRAAKRVNENVADFIGRNFRYLSIASFTSDMFIKFSAVALVILAQRPDWVAPVLIACTGDYLIQGRGFILSTRLSVLLGVFYLVLATIILIWFEGFLWYSFLAVLFPLVLSMCRIEILIRAVHAEEE